uniref:Uncharacterized protein n=1 Tax=Arundo donax TaxID=35708 RepID=A0A0A9DJV5_ARUDO
MPRDANYNPRPFLLKIPKSHPKKSCCPSLKRTPEQSPINDTLQMSTCIYWNKIPLA